MARVRVGVVVLVPQPVAAEIDGLRRAFADPALERVAPHITLVPPVNVAVDAWPQALALVRAAAGRSGPLELRLGPVAAFATDEHVAYLEVTGAEDHLATLRDALFAGPLRREVDHAFVPHVTVTMGLSADELALAVASGASYVDRTITVERVHVLEERHTDAGRRWVPVADVALGPPVIVGRGGLPWELTSGELVDPEAGAWLAGREVVPADHPDGTRPLVTVARREDVVVGVGWGWTAGPVAELVGVQVAAGADGTDGHVRAAWRSAAADRGAS